MENVRCRPSNIRTGWRQKYFYKVEDDAILNSLIEMFARHGNSWTMRKDKFDKIITKNKTYQYYRFDSVYYQVLDIEDDLISFKKHVIESITFCNWKWSFRAAFKNYLKHLSDKLKTSIINGKA